MQLTVPLLPVTVAAIKYVWIVALQFAVVPIPMPAQFQLQGPVPDTVVAEPALQRLLTGAIVKAPPLLEPQLPLITTGENTAIT